MTRLIEAAGNLQARAILMALYSTGMRRTELIRLRVDSERKSLYLLQTGEAMPSAHFDVTPYFVRTGDSAT